MRDAKGCKWRLGGNQSSEAFQNKLLPDSLQCSSFISFSGKHIANKYIAFNQMQLSALLYCRRTVWQMQSKIAFAHFNQLGYFDTSIERPKVAMF